MQNSPKYSVCMNYDTCGAMTRARTPCNRLPVAAGKRCGLHGGYSTGPRSLIGKLRNGETIKRYRIVPAPGYRHKGKQTAERLARARRQATQALRDERKRLRALKWGNRQRAKQGLPLLTDAQLDSFTQGDDLTTQFVCDSPSDNE